MRCKILLVATLLLLVPTAGNVTAQIIYGQPVSGGIGFTYSSWSLDQDGETTDLTQFATPLQGFVPLADNFEAMLYIDNSSNKLETGGVESKLNGLGDVRLQVSHSFSEDRFVFGLGLNLPTGKKKLTTDEEVIVLTALSQSYFTVPMRRFGQGLGITATLGAATLLGEWRCGVGASYQYTGKYDPYEGVTDYNPGDVFTVNVGFDRTFDKITTSADVIFSSYAADQLEDEDVFKQSTQVSITGGIEYAAEKYRLGGTLSYLARGRNDLYTGEDSELKIYGDEFRIAGQMLYLASERIMIGPMIDFRSIAENDLGYGSSSILGFGALFSAGLSDQFNLNSGLKYFTGSTDGGDIDLSGLQLSFGLSASM
ncbi:MAG TPA: hypothetical protein PLF13_09465 [candidate division Zixibacteria bacterium]|nr:hypothetical protein [candidate division Zixibacteria bacterium]